MTRTRALTGCALMFGLLAICLAGCGGAASTTVVREGLDLTQLVVVDYLEPTKKPDKYGGYGRLAQQFFDKTTGTQVEGVGLLLRSEFSEGLCPAQRNEDGPVGYVDKAGRIVIPFKLDHNWFADFHEGRAVAAVDGKDGMIDKEGHWVVPPGRYEALGPFREGRCAFRVGKLWGFLDRGGRVVIEPSLLPYNDGATPYFSGGLCPMRDRQGSRVYLDAQGKVTFTLPKDAWGDANDCSDGLVRVCYAIHAPEGGLVFLYGYVSADGKTVVKPTYKEAAEFSEGLAAVSENARTACMPDREVMMDNPQTHEDERWGFIDTTGKMVISQQFERAGKFSGGLARVRKDGKWGYIDNTGRLVIEPRFVCAMDFHSGVAEVWLFDKKKVALINPRGEVIAVTAKDAYTF